MALFGNYEKTGAGIAKDAPKKKPFFRFWELVGGKFWKLLELNLLMMLTFLPLVLIYAVYLPLAELVDLDKELERLQKEEERLTKELARVNGMLNNERFISKAPQAKIDEEKAKLEKYTQMMEQVKQRLAQLG